MNLLEKRLKEKYPNENFEVLEYTRMKDKAKVKCLSCGEIYESKAENFLRKTKVSLCTKCGMDLHFKQSYQDKINKKYPNEEILILNFNGAKGKLKVKCLKCGNVYEFNTGEAILKPDKKRVCSHCFPNKREALNNTKEKFNTFIQETVLFKNFVIPENYNSNTIIESTCTLCGEKNYKTMYDYLRGRGCMCQSHAKKLTKEEYQKRIGDSYELLSEYDGLNNNVLIRHKDCGFIYKTKALHISCPKCKGSNGEKEIRYWLKNNNIFFIEEYGINIENHLLRFDFYLPDLNIFIEYQGIQHYEPIEYFGGEAQFKKQQYYDNLKRKYADGRLLEIKYDEDISLKLNEYITKNPVVQRKTSIKDDDIF